MFQQGTVTVIVMSRFQDLDLCESASALWFGQYMPSAYTFKSFPQDGQHDVGIAVVMKDNLVTKNMVDSYRNAP